MRLNDPREKKNVTNFKKSNTFIMTSKRRKCQRFLGNVFHFLSPTPNEKRKKIIQFQMLEHRSFILKVISKFILQISLKLDQTTFYFLQSNFFNSK